MPFERCAAFSFKKSGLTNSEGDLGQKNIFKVKGLE